MWSLRECRRCFEKARAQARHLLDELAGWLLGFRLARQALDVIGERPDDGCLGSKTDEPELRDEPAIGVRLESCERGDVREHVSP